MLLFLNLFTCGYYFCAQTSVNPEKKKKKSLKIGVVSVDDFHCKNILVEIAIYIYILFYFLIVKKEAWMDGCPRLCVMKTNRCILNVQLMVSKDNT